MIITCTYNQTCVDFDMKKWHWKQFLVCFPLLISRTLKERDRIIYYIEKQYKWFISALKNCPVSELYLGNRVVLVKWLDCFAQNSIFLSVVWPIPCSAHVYILFNLFLILCVFYLICILYVFLCSYNIETHWNSLKLIYCSHISANTINL